MLQGARIGKGGCAGKTFRARLLRSNPTGTRDVRAISKASRTLISAQERSDVATDEPLMASVAGRYASALFELATEEGKVAEVEGDLAKFQALCDESVDFVRMIRSPVISSDDQEKALDAVLTKAGVGSLTVNFFKLLAKNRRLFAAGDIVRDFQSLAARARGEVRAEVTAASSLSDQHVADLKAALKATVGKDVALVQKVDPSILGGLVVKIGSRMVDSSLKTKLESMRFALKGSA